MSSIYIRDKKSGVWYYKVVLPNGRAKYISLKTKDKKLAKFQQKQLDAQYERIVAGLDKPKVPILPFFQEFMRTKPPYLKPTSEERYRKIVEHLTGYVERLGLKYLQDIKKETAADYAAYRSDDVSNATINMELDLLKAILNAAEERDLITKNPLRRYRRLREADTAHELKFYTAEEISKLKDVLPAGWRDYFITILYTGMRLGELLNLQPEDVDSDRLRIANLKTASHSANKHRYVKIHPEIMPILEDRKEQRPMFPIEGRSKNHLRRILERACKAADIPYKTIHALRHTFASQLAMNGTSLRKIQKLLGHSDYKMTEIYAHLLPSELDDDVDGLSF